MDAETLADHFDPDETHITDDYGDLGLSTRHAVQMLLEESTAVGVVMGHYDDDLSITFVSKIFAKNLGYDPQKAHEFTGRSLRELVFDNETALLDSLKSNHAMVTDHIRLKDATGAPFFVEINKSDVVDRTGRVCWLLTARIAPEVETLSLVNEVFQTGTWSLSCNAQGEIDSVEFSLSSRRMIGYTDVAEFPNSIDAYFSIIHPDDVEMAKATIEAAINDVRNDFNLDITYRARVRDGAYVWLRSVGAASRRLDGSVSKAVGITLNVDEQERQKVLAQQLLREKSAKEELLGGLLRLVERYALCDLGNDTYEFYKFDQRSGYPASGRYSALLATMDNRLSVVGETTSFSAALSPSRLRSEIQSEDDVYRFDYAIRGSDQYLGMAVIPLDFTLQGVSRVLLVAQDITQAMKEDLRSRQALKDAYSYANRANDAKTQFLSQMSHEIRTPMNGIVGMTALAAAHADDPERVRDSLRKITLSSRHLLSLINEVLDMSKIESGCITLNEEEFNFSDLIESLITMVKPQVDEKHHQLSVTLKDLEHEDVVGDALRLQQVFINLMGNAVKYTPEGGHIRLTVSELPCNQSRFGRYEFVFEDDGIGMTSETLDKIFEPFARARDARVERVRGAGLGMPISRNIVRMMGGDIHVESALDIGTRYTVTVFLKLQDKSSIPSDKFVNLDVLVADDDPLALDSCCDMLNGFGMRAQAATGGCMAVEMVVANHEQKRDFFACILDLKMPDMNGIECARAIRRSVGTEMPIIIISAYDWNEFEAEAREAGVNAFISKPLFKSRLLSTFDELVGVNEDKQSENAAISSVYPDKRVLVVEDNAINLEVVREILKLAQIKVDTAADGEQAVRMVCESDAYRYDMVLMDVMMPRMDGHQATRAIRSCDNDYCRNLPIVAMTANAFAEDVQAALEAGMNEHIAKPIDFKKLSVVLETYFS